MTSAPGPTRSAYRPEVDGLRAVAVSGILLFHAFPTLMPGAFTGVDVFFVISGYLITGLMLPDLEAGRFSLARFYVRRMKRLLPALAVVSMVTLLVSTVLLEPGDYRYFTTSLAAAWAYCANLFFAMLSTGYFSPRSETFPFLHTWSLSVEEQFYLLYPLLAMGCWKLGRRWMVPTLGLIAVVCVVASELHGHQPSAYYLLWYRAHELLIGALAAVLTRGRPSPRPVLAIGMSWLGLGLTLWTFFLLDHSDPYPGYNSLYPSIGTVLMIVGLAQHQILSRWFSSTPMVFIGRISYSLYLWHWPIFALLRYRGVDMTVWVSLAALGASVLLAWLTLIWVENPLRRGSGERFSRVFAGYYVTPAAVALGVGVLSYATDGLPQRFPPEVRTLIASYSAEVDLSRKCSIREEDFRPTPTEELIADCAFGTAIDQRPDILLYGDSHAHHLKPFIEELTNAAGRRAVLHTQGNCGPLQGVGRPPQDVCERRNAWLIDIAPTFRTVILAGQWKYLGREAELEEQLSAVVSRLQARGVQVIVAKDTPISPTDMSRCILLKRRGWDDTPGDCTFPRAFVDSLQATTDKTFDHVATARPGLSLIDLKPLMCDGPTCRTYEGDMAYFRDNSHLNFILARNLAKRWMAQHLNPLVPAAPRAASPAGLRAAPQ